MRDCLCEKLYYDRGGSNGTSAPTCTPCLLGANCSVGGTTVATLHLERGYWRANANSTRLYRCPDASAASTGCIGGVGDPCKASLRGAYCRVCVNDSWFYDEGASECRVCDASTVFAANNMRAAIFLISIACVALITTKALQYRAPLRLHQIYLASTRSSLTVKLRLLVTFFQIICRVPRVYLLEIPADLRRFIERFDLVLSLNLVTLVPLRCLGLRSFLQELIFTATAPLLFYVVVLALAILRALARTAAGRSRWRTVAASKERPGGKKANARDLVSKAILAGAPLCLFVAYLTMPYVSSLAFGAFNCECFDDVCLMRVDFAVQCNSGGPSSPFTAEYNQILSAAAVVIVCYSFCTPLVFLLLLRRARVAILSRHSTQLSRALAMLHSDYLPNRYYWEV